MRQYRRVASTNILSKGCNERSSLYYIYVKIHVDVFPCDGSYCQNTFLSLLIPFMVWPCLKVSGLAKTTLQGTVKGKRNGGRQKKMWEDNIKEWTGMDFASSTKAAENRTRWKESVANSSVVPRRPSKIMVQNRNRNR